MQKKLYIKYLINNSCLFMYLVFSMNVIRRIRQIIYLHNIFSPCLTESDEGITVSKNRFYCQKVIEFEIKGIRQPFFKLYHFFIKIIYEKCCSTSIEKVIQI